MDTAPGYAAPPANRMAPHLKAIAVVNFVLAGLGLLACVVLFLVFSVASAATGAAGVPPWVSRLVASVGLLLIVFPLAYAVLALMAGVKLNQHKRSGKTLAAITAVLSLFNFPLGTAFGVYALWALFQKETDALLAP